jgi:hypothetical protein
MTAPLKARVHPDTMLFWRLLVDSSLDKAERDQCERALNRLVSRAASGEPLDWLARRLLIGLPKQNYRLTTRRRPGRPNVGAMVADFLGHELVPGIKREAVYAAAEKQFGLTRRRILQIAREAKLSR